MINLDVFSTSTKNRVGSQICDTDIIIEEKWGSREQHNKLLKNGLHPRDFNSSISQSPVFRFSTRSWYNLLVCRLPGNQIKANEYTIATCTTSVIWTAGLISISESCVGEIRWRLDRNVKRNGGLQMSQNMLDGLPMSGGMMHKLTNFLDANEISGRVKVQYWRAPTMLRYSVGLERGSPS